MHQQFSLEMTISTRHGHVQATKKNIFLDSQILSDQYHFNQ